MRVPRISRMRIVDPNRRVVTGLACMDIIGVLSVITFKTISMIRDKKKMTYHNYFDLMHVLAYFRLKCVTLS